MLLLNHFYNCNALQHGNLFVLSITPRLDVIPGDMMQIAMVEMQRANTIACDFLTAHGCNGHLLKAEMMKKKEVALKLVTVPHSQEHVA